MLAAETVRPVIVAYHQGTRTAGLHEPQLVQQRLWEPLFVKYKVQLVLQGHNHLYERINYKGITYVTTGGGGTANLYPCARKTAGLVLCKPAHHFLHGRGDAHQDRRPGDRHRTARSSTASGSPDAAAHA